MRHRSVFGIAALGLVVAAGLGFQARAQLVQDPFNPSLNPGGLGVGGINVTGGDDFFNVRKGAPAETRIPPRGTWAEIIHVNSKWIVVQNQDGQQFPIASDHIRQFLVRWPSSAAQITPNTIVEVTGPEVNNVIATDHVDLYEGGAQSLVTPAVNILYGANRALLDFEIDQLDPFGILYSAVPPQNQAATTRMHLVGNAVSNDPIRIASFANNSYAIQPGLNGLSITQVTLGNNSYAKKGDLVYVVPENLGPRTVDVGQLVLYKKVPFARFQP
ncbi:hypothetical protein P12x_001222 [Tundrisphaera lichenicola]|uniref:hypothetical protein n=1 Tax=Tundrisphaera lichenicola TaxID=2029860 RepID=UPI003EBE09D4